MATLKKNGSLKALAHLGAFVTATAWGLSFVSTKALMQAGLSPVEMYVYRFMAAYILLLCLTFKKILANNWRDELQLLLCGVCAGSLYFITENYALQNTSAGNVSLLGSISPLFTAAIMALVFRTKVGTGIVIGSIVAFAGVACVIFSSGEGFVLKPTGDLLALSASLSWAIYTLAVKRLIPVYSGLFITRKLFFYGVITALPFFFWQHSLTHTPYNFSVIFDLSQPSILLNFAFLVIFCSVCAYLVWNQSMSVLGPVACNNYLYLQPLTTMIAAYFIFDEKIYPLGYAGCALIIGGLIIADKLKVSSRHHRIRN